MKLKIIMITILWFLVKMRLVIRRRRDWCMYSKKRHINEKRPIIIGLHKIDSGSGKAIIEPLAVLRKEGAYQVACHLGKDDKCLAVRKTFGSIVQCDDEDFCLEGLDGAEVDGCGNGSRIGRATIALEGGGEITVVNVHGTSGVLPDDAECRAAQVEQVFVDLDGEPAANGERNVILGDLNVDPGRTPSWLDESAGAWNEYVGGDQPFQWVTEIGWDAPPTYAGLLNIDHVVSDAFTGTCVVPGVTDGFDDVYPPAYFDHKPHVCQIGDL